MVLEDLLRDLSPEELRRVVQTLFDQSPVSVQESFLSNLKRAGNHTSPTDKPTLRAKGTVTKEKKFDIKRFRQRHIAFQLQYDGGKLFGFAAQDGGVDTVENHFFAALERVNLIADRKTCNYSRCGRTDKGVSALGQVVALHVRSSIPPDVDITQDNYYEGEMDYCCMLNRVLPEEVRVLGWTEVTPDFSARFSATNRRYRYFFVRRDLDISAMQQACTYLLGAHDFRNLCKLDVANVSNFVREIYSAQILCVTPSRTAAAITVEEAGAEDEVWMLEICGIAFLWHMVRCIMSVLFLVGERKETPEIVHSLLNISSLPSKPSYSMAADLPLVLHHCAFERLAMEHSVRALWELHAHFTALRDRALVSVAQANNALSHLLGVPVRSSEVVRFVNELREKERKQQRSGKKVSSASTSESSMLVKRKAEVLEIEDTEEDRSFLSWSKALHRIFAEVTLRPSVSYAPHIPLLQRKREMSYEARVKVLEGQKKTRFERHSQLSGGGESVDVEGAACAQMMDCEDKDVTEHHETSTEEFFETMRAQGSLTLLKLYPLGSAKDEMVA